MAVVTGISTLHEPRIVALIDDGGELLPYAECPIPGDLQQAWLQRPRTVMARTFGTVGDRYVTQVEAVRLATDPREYVTALEFAYLFDLGYTLAAVPPPVRPRASRQRPNLAGEPPPRDETRGGR